MSWVSRPPGRDAERLSASKPWNTGRTKSRADCWEGTTVAKLHESPPYLPFLVTLIGTLPNAFQDTLLLIFPTSWGRRFYYCSPHFWVRKRRHREAKSLALGTQLVSGGPGVAPWTTWLWSLPPPGALLLVPSTAQEPSGPPGTCLLSGYNRGPKLDSQHRWGVWKGWTGQC